MSKKIQSDLDFQSIAKPINLPDPTGAQDAATKAYVDSAVEGLAWKDSVRVASTANLNLASPGASIDGITLTALDRVLVKNQTTTADNGIYVFNGAAAAMTRAADCSTAAELEQAITTVEEGTANAATSWRQTAVNFTLATDPVAWTAFAAGASAASESTAGTAELATQAETDAGTDDLRIVTPLKLTNFASKKLKATGNIGDGAATQYDITHNFGSRALVISIFRNSTPWDDILCDVGRPDTNTVRLNFATAPTTNQFTYVILG